jgi:peptidoglycan DL-endopeptidase CwlO
MTVRTRGADRAPHPPKWHFRPAGIRWPAMLTATRRILTFLATTLMLVVAFVDPAAAEPGEDSGTNLTVRQALDKALGEYNDAKGRLDKSTADQAAIEADLVKTQTRLAELEGAAGTVPNAAYRGRQVW